MKKNRLSRALSAATSLAAISVQHHTEASSILRFSENFLRELSDTNSLTPSLGVSTLDFKNLTLNVVENLGDALIDLTGFKDLRQVILPWFAVKLNIRLPEGFGLPKNDSYGRIKIISGNNHPTKDTDLNLDLTPLLQGTRKVILDTQEVPLTTLNAGSAAQVIRNEATTTLTVASHVESIGDVKDTALKLMLADQSTLSNSRPSFSGLPSALIGSQVKSLDVSAFEVKGQELNVVDMPNLQAIVTDPTDTITSLRTSGEKEITITAPIEKLVITSSSPDQTAVDEMSKKTTTIVPLSKQSHIDSFVGKTDLDFSTLELSAVETTADRIIEIFTRATPINTIQSLKIGSEVLNAVMTKMSLTNLNGFTVLKRLELIGAKRTYQTTSLVSNQLPASLEEFYSSNLVVRKGTLSSNLTFDKKHTAAELDLSGLVLNGHTLTISDDFSATSVNTLKLNPSLLSVAAINNLITAGSSRSIIVSGAAAGVINISNLQNVSTIDLRAITGASSLSAAFNIDGPHTNLSQLYLPSGFDLTAANVLAGVNDGEVTVHISGAYAGAITLDATYNNAILNFLATTGTGRFCIPSGIRGLILNNAVNGINVGGPANIHEFNLASLAYLRQLSGLPSTATVLTLDNNQASVPLELNLSTLNALITLGLNNSKVNKLTLPSTNTLTNGGAVQHLNMSRITSLSELIGLDALLAQGNLTEVSFPEVPSPNLHVDLSSTVGGINFINLGQIPYLTLDSTYSAGDTKWPTVINKNSSQDWGKFFNYLLAPLSEGGANSPTVFDLSGQMLENETQALALVEALNHNLSQARKNALERLIVRFAPTCINPIDMSGIETADFSHTSLLIVSDQSTGSTSSLTYPADWNNKTRSYIALNQVIKGNSLSWAQYLSYRFSSISEKGEGSTSLDLSSLELSATEWAALMTVLDNFSALESIQTIHVKLAADANAAAPVFTTGTLNNLTSVVIDISGFKNAGSQVTVAGLPASTIALRVEQRVNSATAVDRGASASWQGYIEYLLRDISGNTYALDLTAASLQLQSAGELTALNTALAGLSSANKLKIQSIQIKLAAGNHGDFNVSTDLTDFTNLASFTVDATGTLNGTDQSAITWALMNAPAYVATYVTNLASVDLDSQDSWNYYLAYRLATDGVGLTNLDLSAVQFTGQADLDAFLISLHGQTSVNKSIIQSIRFKLAATYTEATFNLGADVGAGAEASGFDHGSFAVTVDRNGANATNPVNVTFGSTGATDPIRSTNTTIIDTSFNGLATFDATNAHHWLGYVRTLLGAVAPAATITLDLSTHTNLEMDNAKSAAFVVAMNSLPNIDKEKVAILKIKLAAGNFGAATADFSGLTGFSGLTDLIVDRNGAKSSANLYDPAATVSGPGTITVSDPELRTVTIKTNTNQWLSYMRFVLNGMTGIVNTLDLSMFPINDSNEAAAFNNAIQALPASEKLKIETLKLSVSSGETLGTSVSGLDNLDRIELTKNAINTITFADNLTGKRTYLTDLSSINMSESTDWSHYLNYMLSTTNGGQGESSLDLNSLTFTEQSVLDAFFAGLDLLDGNGIYGNKSALKTVRLTLDDGLNAMSIGRINNTPTVASALAPELRVVVDPGTSTGTTFAGTIAGEVYAESLIVLSSTPALSRDHITYLAEQGSFTGTIDLSSLTLANQAAVEALFTDLDTLPADIKAKIKVLNIKLVSENYGQPAVTLNNLTNFTGLTINVDRNGARDGVQTYDSLVTITNNTSHTVTLFDSEYNDMATFDSESSANWVGYLTHELNSAPDGDTLDLTTNNVLILTSANAVAALNEALHALNADLKTKVAALKLKASVTGSIGTGVTGFDNLATIIVDYAAAGVASLTRAAGFGPDTPNMYHYLIDNGITPANSTDWVRYFDYRLNTNMNGGLGTASIVVNQHLSGAQLTNLLTGLNNATNKALLVSLTLNLASNVSGNVSFGAEDLDALTNVTINTNGSAAKLTPTDSFIGTASFLNAANIDPTSSDSWAAYFAGQSSLAVVDIKEIELADQAELTAFLTALTDADNKADVASIKLKLASAYADGTVDFSTVDTTGSLTSLLAADSVEIHRNGSPSTTTQGGDITDAKIKVVDLTAASLTNRSNAESWRRYLTQVIEDVGFTGTLDLALDSDTYLRENAHVTALMTGLQNLSTANKALVTDINIKLANSASWSNITDLGQGLSDFDNLTAFTVDATGTYIVGGAQATIGFHADLRGIATSQAIVTSLSSVDKDSSDSWIYYIQGLLKDHAAPDYDLNLTSVSLAEAEFPALMSALLSISNNGDITARDNIQKIRLKLTAGVWSENLTNVGMGWNGSMSNIDTFTVDTAGATVGGNQLTIGFHGDLTAVSDYTRAYVSTLANVDKDNAASWGYYLDYLTKDGAAALDLSSTTLTATELGTLDTALNAFSTAAGNVNDGLLSSIHIKISGTAGAATVNLTSNLDAQTAIDSAEEFIVDISGFEHNGTQATVSHTGGAPKTVQLRVSDITKLYRAAATSWGSYFTHLYPTGIPATTTVDLTGSTSAYLRNQADVTALMSALNGHADKLNITTLNLRLAPGNLGSDVIFNSTGGWNPTMTITATGARNEETMIEAKDVHFTGSMTSVSKTITQDLSFEIKDPTLDTDWTTYLKTLLSPTSEGGANSIAVSILADMLPDAGSLAALMTGLQNLNASLKSNLTHLYLDLRNIAGGITLGTGVTGFTALTEITYTRLTGEADAAAANGSSFDSKIQRLRPDWDSNAIASIDTVGEYLRYVLMDTEMGGAGLTLINLTPQELDNAHDGYVYMALQGLPSELLSRIIELRLNFNTSAGGDYSAIVIPNLATVKYFQDNVADPNFVAPTATTPATVIRFRTLSQVFDKESPTQWAEYFFHQLAPVAQGGLNATTIDVSSVDLGNDQVTWFWGGLRHASLNDYRTNILSIKFAVDNTGGDRTFEGDSLTYNDNLKIIAIMNNKPTSTFTLSTGGQGFKDSLGADLSSSIVEHKITSLSSVLRNNATSWGYYLNHLKAQGNIESIDLAARDLCQADEATTQANIDAFFEALNLHADKASVKDIFLNISGIDSLTISIGTGTANLDGLESVVIRRHADGNSSFPAAGGSDVSSDDITIISNNAGGLGNGSVAQWKGYLAYLLEDDNHKGGGFVGDPAGTVVYNSAEEVPITLNLSILPLRITSLAGLNNLEIAISELPVRLKTRISGVLIKTMDDSTDLSSMAFGTALNGKLNDFTELKAIIIDASATSSPKKPAFAGVGELATSSAISKIVY